MYSLTTLLPVSLYFKGSDNLASDFGLCVDYDFCLVLIKSLSHVTPLCIWVLSIHLHLHFTIRNTEAVCRHLLTVELGKGFFASNLFSISNENELIVDIKL